MELPKVSLTNDVKTIDLAYAYIEKLNEIWETQVLNNPEEKPAAPTKPPAAYGGYNFGNTMKSKAIFA